MNKNQEEMKNTLEGINTRIDKAEDWMSKLEDKVNKHLEQQHEKDSERTKTV